MVPWLGSGTPPTNLGDLSRAELAVLDVRRAARADTMSLGRGVDRDEDDVGLCDGLVDGGREEHVLAAHRLHDLWFQRAPHVAWRGVL